MNNAVINNQMRRVTFPLVALVGLLLLQVLVFHETYWSMVQIWWRSETFAHGFFILPISSYLIWRKRASLKVIDTHTDWRALPFLAVLCVIWQLAYAVDVDVVKQFSIVLMLPVLVWLSLGIRLLLALAFPMAFLLFAVPFGEFLVYPLMEFTAVFTVNAVRAVGIPVFWEGLYFTLPTGSWSVVEACSGFRYILASLTLGALYAYLNYRSIWRRSAFMLFALIVPIIANGFRAFMIVMIGHFSGMELAVGVDHLVYGWVWFGIVMFFMFWIGSFWQESDDEAVLEPTKERSGVERNRASVLVLSVAVAVLVLPAWLTVPPASSSAKVSSLEFPQRVGQWELLKNQELSQWQPYYQGATQELGASYDNGTVKIALNVAFFDARQQGAELVNSTHYLVKNEQKNWKELFRTSRLEQFEGYGISLTQTHIKSAYQHLLVWHWKFFDAVRTNNDLYIKLLQAWGKLSGKPPYGSAFVVYVEIPETLELSEEMAQQQLRLFVEEVLPSIESVLDQSY